LLIKINKKGNAQFVWVNRINPGMTRPAKIKDNLGKGGWETNISNGKFKKKITVLWKGICSSSSCQLIKHFVNGRCAEQLVYSLKAKGQ